MSGPTQIKETPITGKRDLVEYLARGSKPKADWRIGTEHEKFAFHLADLRPLDYAGSGASVRGLLQGLMRFGWQGVFEGENLIALAMEGQSISLEPGGQIELSGATRETVHQTCDEVNTHLAQVKTVGNELGIGMLGLGFHPTARREQIPIMPKGRYAIMRAYMPKRGGLGLDMMLRTCTVQVNLDFGDEADMVRKLRVSLALQPIVTALYANSPFIEGRPSGWLSARSRVWTDTDPDRTGMLAFAFEDGMGFERYVDYALDVPMYFVYRDSRYIDAAGQSFRDFLAGRLPALPGVRPSLRDWADHLTTIFPEVRLKQYLEMRGADGGPWGRLCALPAFWAGILYDAAALDAAWELCKHWDRDQRQRLRDEAPKLGLQTRIGATTIRDLAAELLKIAEQGLAGRARLDRKGRNETHFLAPLVKIVESGRTPAEDLLALYAGRWQGSVEPVFSEFAY